MLLVPAAHEVRAGELVAGPPASQPRQGGAGLEPGASAAPLLTGHVPPGRTSVRVPILMYHYVRATDPRDPLGWGLSVTPAAFAAQMDWLQAAGYHPVDIADLRAYLEGNAVLPSRPVVLSFDDGYADLYTTAYPILRAHGFKAVAYLISGFLNSPRNVTGPQVQEMSRHGIEIGSHTFSHPDLTQLDPATLDFQLARSKQTLEQLTGLPVVDFCYPAGRFDPAVIDAARRAGYLSATTTEPGTSHTWADRMTWTRIRVSGGESLPEFVRSLGTPEPSAP